MKKLLSILMVVAMLLATFTGCANNQAADAPDVPVVDTPAAPAEKVELTVAIWGDEARKAAFEETLAPFCEANNCTVNIQLVPAVELFSKLAAQIAAGTAPDVFWLADGNEGNFVSAGLLADLKEALASDANYMLDDFYKDAIYSTDYNGTGSIYGVPFSFGARAIFYNKTLFEAAGVETPADCVANGTWTYEKMFELADAIHEYDSNKIGVKLWNSGQTTNGVQNFADILAANDTNLMNADSSEFMLDSEEGIGVTKMILDAMNTGIHAQPGDDAAFQSGNIAMARETYSSMKTVVASNVDFEWDVVPQPYGSAGADGKLYTGYAYWCANATSKNADLAVELVKFVTNPENQMAWSKTFMCPRASVMGSDTILNLGDGFPSAESIKAAYVDSVAERGLFTYRGTPDFAQLQTTVQQYYEMIWAGAYSVEDGIAAMKDAVAPYLN